MSQELKAVFYKFCGQGMGASKAAETTDIDSAKFAKLVRKPSELGSWMVDEVKESFRTHTQLTPRDGIRAVQRCRPCGQGLHRDRLR